MATIMFFTETNVACSPLEQGKDSHFRFSNDHRLIVVFFLVLKWVQPTSESKSFSFIFVLRLLENARSSVIFVHLPSFSI